MRTWSVQNARWLKALYGSIEFVLRSINPALRIIGYQRLNKPFVTIEKIAKGFLFDSKSCGQCIVGATGMSCPMNCPKKIRNGPCGGVRSNGNCEVNPEMPCVWVLAWDGNKRFRKDEYPIQVVQPPIDYRLAGKSSWLRELQHQSQQTRSQMKAGNEV